MYAALLLVVLVGSYFRLVRLERQALRADTIHFWNICRSNITAWQVVTEWKRLPVGQPPLPLAVTKLYIDVLGLPVNHFTLRLPSALFGILAIPVMFLVGRRLGSDYLGLVLALLLAMNAFHIQTSREAYFYSSLILGACLMFLGTILAVRAMRMHTPLGPGFYWASGSGFFLAVHSQFTGWSAAFVQAVLVVLLMLWNWKKRGGRGKDVTGPTMLYLVLGVTVLAAPWGLGHLLGKLSSAEKDVSLKALAVSGENLWSMLRSTPLLFAWGKTPVRVGVLVLALVLGALVMWRERRRWLLYGVFVFVMVGSFVMYAVSRRAIGAAFESRYISGVLPIYLAIIGLGIWRFPDLPFFRKVFRFRRHRVLSWALLAVVVALLYGPADASTRMTGNPVPYRDIHAWVESNLPKGTPILVDRWFEPWNELAAYPSTNVIFAFTVPNEPVDVYLQHRWRDTARHFLEKYRDAAYLEITKSYWEVPSIGPWTWPREYFAHHVVFTNEAGVALRNMGLAGRGDFYGAYSNRLVVELFYNTREDVVNRARAAGERVLVLYGEGWMYTKLWQQTRDFRDWRVLQQRATLDLYNLGEQPVDVELALRGVALSGHKDVRVSQEVQHTFSPGQLEWWLVGTVTLRPGRTPLVLSDPLWTGVPLLVDEMAVREVAKPPPVETAEAPQAAPAGKE